MSTEDTLVSFGLSSSNLFTTQGALCVEKFKDIIAGLNDDKLDDITKAAIADGLNLWGVCSPQESKEPCIRNNAMDIYSVITKLGLSTSDTMSGSDYKGGSYAAGKIAQMLQTAGQMDTSQSLSGFLAPLAYTAAENILSSGLKLEVKTPFQNKENDKVLRGSLIESLLGTLPYSGKVNIPNGIKVIKDILIDTSIPKTIKTAAKSKLSTMGMINPEGLVNSGAEIMDLVKSGDNDDLLMLFISNPDMYLKTQSAVEDNIGIFLRRPYMQFASLFLKISQTNPSVLIPHESFFLDQFAAAPALGSITLMLFEQLAQVDANNIFTLMPALVEKSSSSPNANMMIAKVWGKVATATIPANAADTALEELVKLLTKSSSDTNTIPVILFEISNIMTLLNGLELLNKHLPTISKFSKGSEMVFTSISEFAAG